MKLIIFLFLFVSVSFADNLVSISSEQNGETKIERFLNLDGTSCSGSFCGVEDIVIFTQNDGRKYAVRNLINYDLSSGSYQIISISEFDISNNEWILVGTLGNSGSPLMNWSVLDENDSLRPEFEFLLTNKERLSAF